VNGGRHAKLALRSFDFTDGSAKRNAGSDIERKSDGRIEALMIDGERRI